MKNLQLYILAAVLLILSVGFFFYKAFILGLPLRPQESVENWEIQAKITFEAKGGPIKFSVFTPRNEGRFTIVDQSVASEGYGLTTATQFRFFRRRMPQADRPFITGSWCIARGLRFTAMSVVIARSRNRISKGPNSLRREAS
jgi:hypothetical protein